MDLGIEYTPLPIIRKMMVLSRVDAGKKVIIQDINGGRGLRSKLYSMGHPGAKAYGSAWKLCRPNHDSGKGFQVGHRSRNAPEDNCG